MAVSLSVQALQGYHTTVHTGHNSLNTGDTHAAAASPPAVLQSEEPEYRPEVRRIARALANLAINPHAQRLRLRLEHVGVSVDPRPQNLVEREASLWARPLDHVATTRVYKRDTKLREAHTKFSEKKFCDAFGYILGQSIASAHAGPEDMAKHSQLGQGSGGGMV